MHSYKPIGLICLCINENVGCYFYILHLVLNYRTRHIELGAIFLCFANYLFYKRRLL